MNFLAHIYLSGDSDFLKIGNFIADSIRGKQYLDFPLGIQEGILLHRAIDSYTDFHPIFRKSKHRLVPNYNHYSGVIVDIFYDHFLAKNWSLYSDIPLEVYAQSFYKLLEQHFELLPLRIQNMIPIMMAENWLVKYRTTEGIQQILTQMDRRTDYQSKMQYAVADLTEAYIDYEEEFTLFFEEIKIYIKEKAINL
ncbi:ACP phosphodiesterase [Flavobacterium sp. JP2137]|uniref:acyl carrier protein phosphodiesterase n=1 Tax=Flavobacterium sp. JP2137 TaxID=3414510 RepID=UPI003D2FAADA